MFGLNNFFIYLIPFLLYMYLNHLLTSGTETYLLKYVTFSYVRKAYECAYVILTSNLVLMQWSFRVKAD